MPNSGRMVFNYASNSGVRTIGGGDAAFDTRWSQCSNESIYAYRNPPSVEAVALATNASNITDIKDVSRYDYSSGHVVPRLGQVLLLRNKNGRYAAIQLLAVTSTGHGKPSDEVTFRYIILPAGSRNRRQQRLRQKDEHP